MKHSATPVARLQKDYERLRRSLAQIGYTSQGSVVDRSTLRPPRSGYQWTRKVKGKTITVALSASEFDALAQAIANERKLNETIRKMERISRRILFGDRPQSIHRKPRIQRALGLI
jgi:hypothetical protein